MIFIDSFQLRNQLIIILSTRSTLSLTTAQIDWFKFYTRWMKNNNEKSHCSSLAIFIWLLMELDLVIMVINTQRHWYRRAPFYLCQFINAHDDLWWETRATPNRHIHSYQFMRILTNIIMETYKWAQGLGAKPVEFSNYHDASLIFAPSFTLFFSQIFCQAIGITVCKIEAHNFKPDDSLSRIPVDFCKVATITALIIQCKWPFVHHLTPPFDIYLKYS